MSRIDGRTESRVVGEVGAGISHTMMSSYCWRWWWWYLLVLVRVVGEQEEVGVDEVVEVKTWWLMDDG